MKKKIIIAIIAVLLLAGIGVGVGYLIKNGGKLGGKGRKVYVESVSAITGVSLGNSSRFMGIVESQESKAVQKDSDKKVKEVYVKEGDYIKEGDKLFCYDTTDMELNLEQLNLDRQGIANTISSLYTSLNDYTTQRNQATDEDDILSYTSQINSTTTSIKEEEYNLASKDLEIKKQQEAIDSAVVNSPMSGVVKSVNSSEVSSGDSGGYEDYDDYSGYSDTSSDTNGFITIIAEGDYRVKGTADEMNIYAFTTGTNVIVRSRVDETQTWPGTVTKVDMEPTSSGNSDTYYYDGGGESASKYNFYINVESTEGMILGQHLYVELDYGQQEEAKGLRLPAYFLMEEDGLYFVWKRGEDGTIVKAQLTVGEYDETSDTYEIKEGLELTDYIAFPEPGIKEGDIATTNIEEVQDLTDGSDDVDYEEEDWGDEDLGPTDSGDGSIESNDLGNEEMIEDIADPSFDGDIPVQNDDSNASSIEDADDLQMNDGSVSEEPEFDDSEEVDYEEFDSDDSAMDEE